jgi:hypothetical protein
MRNVAVAAGQLLAPPYEAWIAADRLWGGVRALIAELRKEGRVRARRSADGDHCGG